MAVSISEWLNGLTAILVVITGVYFGLLYLFRYIKKRRKLQPYVAGLGFLAGFFYIGTSINFLSYLLTGNNISVRLYGWLSYSWIPVASLIAMWLGFTVFKPDFQKQIKYIFLALWAIYWFCLFVFPDRMMAANNEGINELLEISTRSIIMVLTAMYIFFLLFIQSGGFFYLRRKMIGEGNDPNELRHITYLGIGWFLFGVASVIDALIPSTLWFLVTLGRLIIIGGYIFIFIGYGEPKKS